jgi:branched-chain amino acid transport system permease protein
MVSSAVLSFARSERFALLALVLAIAFPIACGFRTYPLFIAAQFAVFAMVALSLDVLMGRSGQISLGHAGFFALGAYAAAILSARFDVDLLAGAIAGAALAALGSLIVGLPATRLSGHYLGIVTLGFGVAVAQIALKWTALTNGDEGVHVRTIHLAGIVLSSPLHVYAVAFVALAAVAVFAARLPRTRLGRAFAAVRDSEIAAAAMGISVARTKVTAFVISAAIAGAAGALYAALTGFVAPEDFGISQSLLFFAMVVVGGTASTAGTLLGALVLDAVSQGAATVGGLSLALIGAAIVTVALFRPAGLKSLWRRGEGSR